MALIPSGFFANHVSKSIPLSLTACPKAHKKSGICSSNKVPTSSPIRSWPWIMPFNLGGRINLLYCFFWGLAAVAWFKVLFPPLDRLIESLPRRGGTILTWCLVVFMAVNMIVSSAALIRYDARLEGVAAQTSLDTLLDEHFDDSYMQRVYPKLVHMN